MLKDMMGRNVKAVVLGNMFEGKLVDVNPMGNVAWVQRSTDNDWVAVDVNVNQNSIELVQDSIEIETSNDVKVIKSNLLKAIKFIDEDDEISVAVKVFDCDDTEQTYDVEVIYYINNEYGDTFVNQTFYGNAEKDAVKRAKSVLKTVKAWFKDSDNVTVENDVEVYNG